METGEVTLLSYNLTEFKISGLTETVLIVSVILITGWSDGKVPLYFSSDLLYGFKMVLIK